MLTLSLFPGIDLLGRAFEAEGFLVVRGPDSIFGQDVRQFHLQPGHFAGIIAGSPCQQFSRKRRHPPTEEGIELLKEFARLVYEAQPEWWLLENVVNVPDVRIAGYTTQRIHLDAREVGSEQSRLRIFQFGSRDGRQIVIRRQHREPGDSQSIVLATDTRDFAEMCRLQGLPDGFDLPGWPLKFKRRAVGNGVPIPMGRAVARAIREAATAHLPGTFTNQKLCLCGCGREVQGWKKMATDACRWRIKAQRDKPRQIVNWPGADTPAASQL